jgi:hypothetical protein
VEKIGPREKKFASRSPQQASRIKLCCSHLNCTSRFCHKGPTPSL